MRIPCSGDSLSTITVKSIRDSLINPEEDSPNGGHSQSMIIEMRSSSSQSKTQPRLSICAQSSIAPSDEESSECQPSEDSSANQAMSGVETISLQSSLVEAVAKTQQSYHEPNLQSLEYRVTHEEDSDRAPELLSAR